jgi:DNA repair protein RadC
VHFKRHRLASQRVVEVEQNTLVFAHLQHHTGKLALVVGRGELHHVTHGVLLAGVTHLREHLARQPLLHGRVAFAKGGTGGQLKGAVCALFQPDETGLHRRCQLARAQRERGGLGLEGVDDVPGRAAHAVMQREKGAWLYTSRRCGHKSLNRRCRAAERRSVGASIKLAPIVETRPIPPAAPAQTMPLKDLPPDARPREKLLARGAGALSDAELLALLLRTGIKGKGVLQMADELLHIKKDSSLRTIDGGFDGISGLLHATAEDLERVKGLGPAKRAELMAVLELARRAMAQQLKERTVFADPDTIKHYLKLHLAAKDHEVFAVLFLDVQNRLLAMEELFRGTLTQLSVTVLRKYFERLRHKLATAHVLHSSLSCKAV